MKLLTSLMLLVLVLAMPPALRATTFTATLNGASEVPPSGSPATGFLTLTLSGNSLTVVETFSGLLGGAAAAAHIHCCAAAGSNAIVAIPFGGFPAATSGSYSPLAFDLTLSGTYNAAFITAHGGTAALAEADFLAAMYGGLTYANIHDATFPGGEIRGQIGEVPEPATLFLSAASLLTLALIRRR